MTIYYTHRYKELKCGSHELLEIAISDYTGDAARAAELIAEMRRDNTHGYEGKPYIDGFDKFSISHSDGSWAVLIGRRECGLDIQYERSCDFIGISRRFFNPEDAAVIEGAYRTGQRSPDDIRCDFFEIWTKREALIKAAGLSVADDNCPPVALHRGAEYNGADYFVSNVSFPGPGRRMHAAICLDASEDIDEKLVYKEIYVKE